MNKENNVYSSGTEEEVPSLSEMRRKKVEAFRLELDLDETIPDKETPAEVFSRTEPSAQAPARPKPEENISSSSRQPAQPPKSAPVVPTQTTTGASPKKRNKKNSGIFVLLYVTIICLVSVGLSVRIIHAAYDLLGAYKEENTASIKITPKTSVDQVIIIKRILRFVNLPWA